MIGQEKIILFGFELENITDRKLIDNGGKAIITTPMGVVTRPLESSGEYDKEFNSKMKENIYLPGGFGLKIGGPFYLNISLQTKAVCTFYS
ncbi:MAG: hypothetical protein N3B16_01940, partial [Candidatus Aminicenantes bacterium]|nr:hypothetical protein [Candidatus Aminicenantes bacterium]